MIPTQVPLWPKGSPAPMSFCPIDACLPLSFDTWSLSSQSYLVFIDFIHKLSSRNLRLFLEVGGVEINTLCFAYIQIICENHQLSLQVHLESKHFSSGTSPGTSDATHHLSQDRPGTTVDTSSAATSTATSPGTSGATIISSPRQASCFQPCPMEGYFLGGPNKPIS